MPPKLPRAALRMVAMAKAKAMKERDDFEVGKAKMKSATLSVKTNKRAKDDSEITKDEKQKKKALIRKELDAWAKDNEPEEGWDLTDNRYKEIRLRKKFLEENSRMSWIEYLKSKDMEIVKEIAKKDNSKVIEERKIRLKPKITEQKLKKIDESDAIKFAGQWMEKYIQDRSVNSLPMKETYTMYIENCVAQKNQQ